MLMMVCVCDLCATLVAAPCMHVCWWCGRVLSCTVMYTHTIEHYTAMFAHIGMGLVES